MKKYLYFLNCIVFFIGSYYHSPAQIIATFAGNGTPGFSGDGGDATLAKLDTPTCLAMDLAGNIYINDQRNNRVRKVDPSGTITTVAGKSSAGFFGDGGPATDAKLDANWGMTVDGAGNIYICDQSNNRIRMVNTSGIINTIAGTGTAGYSGDGGPATAAKINAPMGIAVDHSGNIYFSDSYNFCVRKIDPSGVISIYAGIPGSAGYSGDGGMATSARLKFIWGIALDNAGNLYLCDGPNDRVRMVDPSGKINTIAGTGVAGYDLDNVPATDAKLNKPLGVFIAPDGKIYISDCDNNRVRKIDNSGIITTIAGTGTPGYNGDGIPAVAARLHHPIGVVVDTNENVFVSDVRNARVRKVINVLFFVKGDDEHMPVCQDAAAMPINDILAVRDVYVGLTDVWTLATPPSHGTVVAGYSAMSTGGVLTPSGLTYKPDPGFVGLDTFRVKVANSLASDIITVYVSVDPLLAPAPIGGSDMVCVGDTIVLNNALTGGVWSSAKGRLQLTPSPPNNCFAKGLSAGLDTLRYIITNACGSISSSKALTVNPLPDAGAIGGPPALCLGDTVSFTATISGGTWSTSNLNTVAIPSGANTCDVKGLVAGPSTLIYKVSDAFCTAATIKFLQVEVFPSAGQINGPVSVCIGDQVLLTDSVHGGIWTTDTGFAMINSGVVSGIAPGDDVVRYSVTNSCGTDVAIRPMHVYPVPAVPGVSFGQGILSAAKGYATYQWKINGVIIPGAVADTLYADAPGVYQVEVTNEFGCAVSSALYDHTGCSPDEIVLFPNPAHDIVSIVWCKKVTVRILCADGKEAGIAENVNQVQLGYLPAGVYILSIFDNAGVKIKTSKIVKL